MIKKWMLAFILILGLWAMALLQGRMSLLVWIDRSFMVGICSLVAAATFAIIKSGFLTLFFKGFRIIGNILIPQSNAAERTNEMIDNDEKWQGFKEKVSGLLTKTTLLIGASALTASLIGLLFYY
jgi:hypothetical protein